MYLKIKGKFGLGVAELQLSNHIPGQASLLTYEAGDLFIMKPGYVGAWRNLETVRKVRFTA